MKNWMFGGLAALAALASAAGSASAQQTCPPGQGLRHTAAACCSKAAGCLAGCSAGCCCDPCIDVYKPCLVFPKLRIPLWCPTVSCYCEAGPPKCGAQPWYAGFPLEGQHGFAASGGYGGAGMAPYGSYSGPVGLGPYASYGNPMATGPGYFGAPGAGMSAQGPSYWYGR